MKVLVVDDDKQGRFLLRRILESSGHVVFVAENGEDAMGQAKVRQPDVIVSDVMMPGCDGFQMCRLLSQDAALRATPVVLCSAAFCKDRDRELAAEVGASAFLEKPIGAKELRRTIDELTLSPFDCDVMLQDVPPPRPAHLSALEFAERRSERLAEKLQDYAQEITEAHDKLRRLDEAKDTFVSIASHELRTPLAILHGYFQLLKSAGPDADPETTEFLEAMEASIERLTSVTRRLLEMSELEREDGLRIERSWVHIPDMCQELIDELRPFWKARDLRVSIHSPEKVPRIRVTPWSIRQALLELVHNAIKFTRDGGSIVVSVMHEEGHIVIRVSDTGIGVPPEERERAFHKFYEVGGADQHTTAKFEFMGGGLGLGLSMVLAVVRDHDGSIAIEDREDGKQGTVVHLALPLGRQEP